VNQREEIVGAAHDAVLKLAHDGRWRAIMKLHAMDYEKIKEEMVDASPEIYQLLQGKAKAYRLFLGLENRATKASESRTRATSRPTG